MTPSRKRPASGSRRLRATARIASASATAARTWPIRRSQATVGVTVLLVRSKQLLELADLHRERRLADAAGLGGTAEMPMLGDRQQVSQVPEVHRVSPLPCSRYLSPGLTV